MFFLIVKHVAVGKYIANIAFSLDVLLCMVQLTC